MTPARGMIGGGMARHEVGRLTTGRGRYTDDIATPGAGHVAFLRSPHAHARIVSCDVAAARDLPGVVAVLTGDNLATVCAPWQTRLAMLPHHRSPPQWPLARGEATWQGEPVVAVVAASRAQAEDAVQAVEIVWEELPAVASLEAAARPDSAPASSTLDGNLGLDHGFETGAVDPAFAGAAAVVTHSFSFGRQTGVTLEPRSIIASFDPRLRQLTVQHAHQVPFQMREVFAAQFGLPLAQVQVTTPDVGGAFGMKLAAYPDEMAVAAIAVLLGRTVRFTADRLESFVSDVHAREATVTARLAVSAKGDMLGMDLSVASGFGAYSAYPRGSVGEGLQAIHMAAAPYRLPALRGRVRGYFQNKVPSGVLRAVGQPIACTVTEQLLDLAAARLGLDPAEIRRRNYASDKETSSAGGIVLSQLSLDRCHDRLLDLMRYQSLRDDQRRLRQQGVYRGIGLAAFIEQTAVGSGLYGPQQVNVAAHEACRLELDPSGRVVCATSVTDQGQGTLTGLGQVIATELGVGLDTIDMVSGDTRVTPFGGGAWASRGAALGGEAALRAADRLRGSILTMAAALLQTEPAQLRLTDGTIRNAAGLAQMTLAELAATAAYRPHTIPLDTLPPLEIVESYAPRDKPYFVSNGLQAAHVEVDVQLGTIQLLDFWVVDDCGTVINPLLVDEQIRGGVVQGIGAALYEHCIYNEAGQLENGSLVDYLVPMAGEMPDIHVAHVETPIADTRLGARGVGEAGAVGAAAAIWTAVNDALSPLGATVTEQPFTPEHVLDRIRIARQAS